MLQHHHGRVYALLVGVTAALLVSPVVVGQWNDTVTLSSVEHLCVTTDAGMTLLYETAKQQDFYRWHARPPRTVENLQSMIKSRWQWKWHDQHTILIYDNKLYQPTMAPGRTNCVEIKDGGDGFCDMRILFAVQFLEEAIRLGLKFPNVLFYLATGDGEGCADPNGDCAVPIFTWFRGMPPGGVNETEKNGGTILVPTTDDVKHHFYDYPWEKKAEKAFFRGGGYCHVGKFSWTQVLPKTPLDNGQFICPRAWLYHYNEHYKVGADLIDAAQVTDKPRARSDGSSTSNVSEPPGYYTLPDHSRFKYLFHLDGAAASHRFAKLLHTNSVVLKEVSGWVEYFYVLLKPGEHYLSVFNSSVFDVFDIMEEYKDKQGELEAIAKRAQQFVGKYLCPPARRLYWRNAVTEYKTLFQHNSSYNAMDDFIENTVWPLVSKGQPYLPEGAIAHDPAPPPPGPWAPPAATPAPTAAGM